MEPELDLQVLAALDRIVASSSTLTQQRRAEWGNDPMEDRLAYIECGTIARYLIELAAIDPSPADLGAIAEAIDREFETVDRKVLNWLQVGLIESIWFISSNTQNRGDQPLTSDEIKARLGPLTRKSWEDLEAKWDKFDGQA